MRTLLLISEQAMEEDEVTVSTLSNVQETLSADAVFRAVAKKSKQREPLTGFDRQTLMAVLVCDLP